MSTRSFPQVHSTLSKLSNKPSYGRRHFLKAGIGACTLLAMPNVYAGLPGYNERKLSFLNLHTGERIHTTYWAEGRYILEGLSAIDRVLRDHRTGELYEIDRNLLDMLQLLNYKMGVEKEFHVISGYRSPATNAQLNARSSARPPPEIRAGGVTIPPGWLRPRLAAGQSKKNIVTPDALAPERPGRDCRPPAPRL